jgi:hypothetical protein
MIQGFQEDTQRLFNALHATNRGLYPAIYSIISIFLTMPVPYAKSETFEFNETHEILLKVDYWRWTAVQLITYCIYTDMCKSTWTWFLGTFHKLIQVKNNEYFMTNKSSESNLYQTCILLFLSALKFRRIYSKVMLLGERVIKGSGYMMYMIIYLPAFRGTCN